MIEKEIKELVTQNPMLIEITRFRRRHFTFTSGNSMNAVVLSLILLCYAGFVLIIAENRDSINPVYLISFETGVLTLFAPMMLYGAIAGERERRSWDLLLAAPISKAQIVFGKFIGAVAALAMAVGLFQIPIFIAATGYTDTNWPSLFAATFMSFAFLLDVCALTILFSARVKRGLMALGAVLGILTIFLIVIPTLTAGVTNRSTFNLSFFHPFVALSEIGSNIKFDRASGEQPFVPHWVWGLPQTVLYIFVAITLLVWASKTLNFAENEVKFLPQGDKNA